MSPFMVAGMGLGFILGFIAVSYYADRNPYADGVILLSLCFFPGIGVTIGALLGGIIAEIAKRKSPS
jgi:hypothetical protein